MMRQKGACRGKIRHISRGNRGSGRIQPAGTMARSNLLAPARVLLPRPAPPLLASGKGSYGEPTAGAHALPFPDRERKRRSFTRRSRGKPAVSPPAFRLLSALPGFDRHRWAASARGKATRGCCIPWSGNKLPSGQRRPGRGRIGGCPGEGRVVQSSPLPEAHSQVRRSSIFFGLGPSSSELTFWTSTRSFRTSLAISFILAASFSKPSSPATAATLIVNSS